MGRGFDLTSMGVARTGKAKPADDSAEIKVKTKFRPAARTLTPTPRASCRLLLFSYIKYMPVNIVNIFIRELSISLIFNDFQ
jgi:hypothetical protein